MARPKGAKDKRQRKRRRRSIISTGKGIIAGSGLAATGLAGSEFIKNKNLAQAGKSLLDKRKLAAIGAAGLLGGGAAYLRRRGINRREREWDNSSPLGKVQKVISRRLKEKKDLKNRQRFNRIKKDVADTVDTGVRLSRETRRWMGQLFNQKQASRRRKKDMDDIVDALLP